MQRFTIISAIVGLVLAACAPSEVPDGHTATPEAALAEVASPTNWAVDATGSTVMLTTIKTIGFSENFGGMEASALPDMIGETHHFSGLSGSYTDTGDATITIPLTTIRTGFEIRDERMRDILFEISSHPVATITASLPITGFEDMLLGDMRIIAMPFLVNLHGHEVDYETSVRVTRLIGNRVAVSSIDPIIINGDDFDLIPGIDILRELANLPAVTPVATVSFSIMFEGQL